MTAMFKLVKTLSIPTYEQCTIRSPKDAFELLEPELRFSAKEQFVCLFLNTKNRVIHREIAYQVLLYFPFASFYLVGSAFLHRLRLTHQSQLAGHTVVN